jgi:branched-chain amino acid transport system ATP-binding protein
VTGVVSPERLDATTLLELAGVVAGYGEIEVLSGVSLRARAAEITCLIGPNGAGKSTVLRTVAGLLTAWSGRIVAAGHELRGRAPGEIFRLGVSFVPQGRCNFPFMTVQENLEMGCFIVRDRAEVRRRVERILDRFPLLAGRRRQRAGTLSGGEQQILEMARALLLEPRVLLIDEPSLGLAPRMVEMVFEDIVKLRDGGVAVVMVEQNARRALQISDQAFVLELGRVRFEGGGREILDNPRVRDLYLGGTAMDDDPTDSLANPWTVS